MRLDSSSSPIANHQSQIVPMRAVRIESGGSVSVVEMDVPQIGPGEALMRTRASGICGSDLLDWYVRRKAGTILGHEVAGEIVAVGKGVEHFVPGDRIVPHHHAPCLSCDACRQGRYVHCRQWRESALDPGGMAEMVRIPAANLDADTQRIPESVSDEEASFTEPLATVVKAFRRARFESGQSVLVVGLGTAGQLALRLARASGALRIFGADRVASRRKLAQESGAEETIEVGPGAPEVPALLGTRRFDLVLVSPGKAEVARAWVDAVAPGGVLLLFTMAAPEETLALSPHDLYFREVSLVPSYSCGPDDTRQALQLISSGRVPVADLVTHRFPISKASDAFARAREPEGSLKVILTS
jgi:L-iditol 2-dehydrogenase